MTDEKKLLNHEILSGVSVEYYNNSTDKETLYKATDGAKAETVDTKTNQDRTILEDQHVRITMLGGSSYIPTFVVESKNPNGEVNNGSKKVYNNLQDELPIIREFLENHHALVKAMEKNMEKFYLGSCHGDSYTIDKIESMANPIYRRQTPIKTNPINHI